VLRLLVAEDPYWSTKHRSGAVQPRGTGYFLNIKSVLSKKNLKPSQPFPRAMDVPQLDKSKYKFSFFTNVFNLLIIEPA